MKALILEDDFAGRLILLRTLIGYGEVDVAVNGREALAAFRMAHEEKKPYDLLCLDIMVPELSGQSVLREVRAFETEMGIPEGKAARVVMTTALGAKEDVMQSVSQRCDAYLIKPVDKARLLKYLKEWRLIG